MNSLIIKINKKIDHKSKEILKNGPGPGSRSGKIFRVQMAFQFLSSTL